MTHDISNKIPLSAVVICKNAEKYISQVLQALTTCDEILVADTGSTDRTIEIVRAFETVRFISLPFQGFGRTKNSAVEHAKYDWILSIDADEVIDEDCLNACIQMIQTSGTQHAGRILRNNFAFGQKIQHSGWGNDRLVRLFNKNHTRFSDVPVHESVDIRSDMQIRDLPGSINHYTVNSFDDFFSKTDFYTSLRVDRPAPYKCTLTYASTAAFFRFVKTFILQAGILDGRIGFVISVANAQSVFWRYVRHITFNERLGSGEH